MMMCQYRFFDCNKCTTLLGDCWQWGKLTMCGAWGLWEISVPSPQLFSEPYIALNKVLFCKRMYFVLILQRCFLLVYNSDQQLLSFNSLTIPFTSFFLPLLLWRDQLLSLNVTPLNAICLFALTYFPFSFRFCSSSFSL